MAELTGSWAHINGIDASQARIKFCREMSMSSYGCDDIADPEEPLFEPDGTPNYSYDVVTAMTVFMHFKSEVDIWNAMANIRDQLRPGGYFVFYDAWAKDHFKSPKDADHWGFNRKQVREFAEIEGFKEIATIRVFRRLFWRYHSAYLPGWRIPFKSWVIEFAEECLPGPPGNFFIIFKKVKT
jgi:SAM-dependent methyltransferase